MGRAPCCDKAKVKRGPWSPDEDMKLKEFIEKHGTGGNWIALPHKAGLERCGKSCRLRWLNYLRPNIKHGEFSDAEDSIICNLYNTIGSSAHTRWSIIASHLPGRTDNDIKNYWNTKLKKKLLGITPSQRKRQSQHHQQQQFERRRQCFSSSLQPPADAGAESSSPLIQNPSTKSPLSGLRCGSQISQAHLLNSVSSGTALFQDPAHHFKVAGNSSGGALLGFGSGEGNSTPDIQHEHGGVGTAGGHWQHMSFGSLPCDEMLDGNHQGLSLADIVGGFDGGHHLVRENEGTAPWREAAPLMEDYGKYEEIKELITSRYPSRVQEEEWEITDLKRGPSTTTTIHCKKLEILFPRSIQGGACLVDDGDIDSRWLSEMGDANVMDDA